MDPILQMLSFGRFLLKREILTGEIFQKLISVSYNLTEIIIAVRVSRFCAYIPNTNFCRKNKIIILALKDWMGFLLNPNKESR